MNLAEWDATELAKRIRDGEVSSVEALEEYLERVRRFDQRVHALVVFDVERARERARELDAERAKGGESGTLGALHGVPMTIKEAFGMQGLPTTFGIPAFADRNAVSDAAVTQKLRAAGAVIYGKTNVPLGLVDFQSYNEIYGTTNNPWDLERTPGGSSGGESAALAAGLTPIGYGSDIGGSLRNPAHYTGTFAHKPTFGVIPHEGHSPGPTLARQDLGVYGPMARSARDLGLGMDVTAGPSLGHGVGWKLALPRRTKPLGELRVAVWPDAPQAPVEAEIAARCVRLAEELAKRGARVSDTARPSIDADHAHSTYVKLLSAALSVAQRETELLGVLRAASSYDPADESPPARHAWNQVMPHRRWLDLEEERERIRLAWSRFFEDWDLVIAPIGCTVAFRHDHRPFGERTLSVDGVERGYFNQLFWAGLATGAYLPSTAIPTGVGSQGLPIGVQMIGAAYEDYFLIDVAEQLEELGYRFEAPPGFF